VPIERRPESPTKLADYLRLTAHADEPEAVVTAARHYLESWSRDSIANIQRIDAGWAPFDVDQRPQALSTALDLRCVRDAIHNHCMALRDARLALPPELVELDEFFYAATESTERCDPSRPPSGRPRSAPVVRLVCRPATINLARTACPK